MVKSHAASIAGLCMALAPTSGITQSPDAPRAGLEEVVVTARRREESLQEIPLSVTAFTAADMAKSNIQDMKDIARFTPGFSFQDFGGGGATAPVIRGANQVAGGGLEQNVSFFFDGIYLPRNYFTNLGFGNIERIEVVKGPQSARYGRNAFMGAINYVSKQPTEDWGADASITAGNHERYDGTISVSGAIIPERLRVRVSADYSEFDGTWPNTHPFADISFSQGTNKTLGGHRKTVLSGAVQFEPREGLVFDLAYYNYDYNEEHRAENWFAELGADSGLLNCGQFNPNVRPAGSGLGGGGQWFRLFCGEMPLRNIPVDPRGYARQLDADFIRASMSWKINDALTLDYLLGDIEAETKSLGYKDTLPGCTFFLPGLCVFENGPLGDFKSRSHEMRLSFDNDGRFSGGLGVFYTKTTDYSTANFAALPQLTAVPAAAVDVNDASVFSVYAILARTVTEPEIWSPFAEFSMKLFDGRGRIGLEARYSREKKFQGSLPTSGTAGLNTFAGLTFEDTFTQFTPRVTLEYKLTELNKLFASAAKGVKSGGYNAAATLPENRTFEDDQNWTYEIGSKNTFDDGRIRLNGTLFLIRWTDVQIFAQDTGNPAPLPLSIIRNLGDVHSAGVEIEAGYAPTDSLDFSGTFYYGDAHYAQGTSDLRWGRIPAVCDDVVCARNGNIGGNQTERQSKVQASVAAEWRRPLSIGQDLQYYARSDVSYQSKQFNEAVNISWIPARTLVNLSTGVVGEKYDVQLWARNLFDKEYVASVIVGLPNTQYNAYLGERRTFGVTGRYRF
jgi:iron complex outermembrane recepter protein